MLHALVLIPTNCSEVLAPLDPDHPEYHLPRRMVGKPVDLLKHVIKCMNTSQTDKTFAPGTSTPPYASPRTPLARSNTGASVQTGSSGVNVDDDGRPRQYRRTGPGAADGDDVARYEPAPRLHVWTKEQADLFARMLCRLLVVCNIAWCAVERPFWRHFFSFWLPGVPMPGRKEL